MYVELEIKRQEYEQTREKKIIAQNEHKRYLIIA